MERTKLGLSKDKMYKALGEGERTSKKVASIRMSDGSTFKRKNANQYGTAEGGNDYTEKRSNRTDRFDLGGTADSSNTGANMGGTMGSSIMKDGGATLKDAKGESQKFELKVLKQLSGFNGGRAKSGILEGLGLSNYQFNKYASKQDNDKLEKTLKHLIKNKFVEEGGVGYKITQSGANHLRTFNHGSYGNGGGLSDLPENPNNDAISYKRGGHVSKGELVWKKLSSSDKINFLYKNFTPQITPRSQEILVGKAFNFLPKNVKIKMESEYANVEEYANGGGLANTPESFPSNDAVSYKTGGRIKKITEWSISTNNEDEHFDNYKDAKDFWNNLDKKEKETGQFFKKSYINGEEDDVEILDGKLSGYANGGTTKGFEYTIGGL